MTRPRSTLAGESGTSTFTSVEEGLLNINRGAFFFRGDDSGAREIFAESGTSTMGHQSGTSTFTSIRDIHLNQRDP